MPRHVPQVIGRYPELSLVVAAAVLGLTVGRPLEWLVRHQGIDVALVILVFSTSLGMDARALRRLPAAWRQLGLTLAIGIGLLPALSWLAAELIAPGHLRQGVTTIGLAPCEIASIATTAMAGGDVALAGGVLIGSTLLTVALAGPILAAENSGASLDSWHILVTLLWVVVAPLAAGIALHSTARLPERAAGLAATTSAWSVAVLVALVASEVHFTEAYLPVAGAIVAFVAVSAGVGLLVGRLGSPRARKAILLTVSMRDFAIAAGIATAAFGAAAAAPLGIYGIVVLVWGTAGAGVMRARDPDAARPDA